MPNIEFRNNKPAVPVEKPERRKRRLIPPVIPLPETPAPILPSPYVPVEPAKVPAIR